jgi:hypothetical protein
MPKNRESAPAEHPGLIARSPEILMELPVEYRWEFTRRHPYYLAWWESAHKTYVNQERDSDQPDFGLFAVKALQTIGVTADPPDPGKGHDELDPADLAGVWKSGAVSPVTFRGLAQLLTQLPPETLERVGQILVNSTQYDSGDPETKFKLISQIQELSDPVLDLMLNGPILTVNVKAPQRTIVAGVEELTRKWKEQRHIPEHRRHDKKLPEYLKVWDRREGWAGDHYDPSQETMLHEIAEELSLTVSTVRTRYQSAFRFIVGHDYRPELWMRLFGVFKISTLFDPVALPRLATRRPVRTRQKRDIPESVLAPQQQDDELPDIIANQPAPQGEFEEAELVFDIHSLISQGRSDAEIQTELELKNTQLVEYFRLRHSEGL